MPKLYDLFTKLVQKVNTNQTDLSKKITELTSQINTLKTNLTPAVGDIEINITGKNPSTKYPNTSWTEWGQGKCLVGYKSGDANFGTVEKTGGTKDAAVISHTHKFSSGATNSTGAHSHTFTGTTNTTGAHTHQQYGMYSQGTAGSESGYRYDANRTVDYVNTNSAGAHSHTVTGRTDVDLVNTSHSHTVTGTISTTGNSGTNANLQPYIVCYFWKRTA